MTTLARVRSAPKSHLAFWLLVSLAIACGSIAYWYLKANFFYWDEWDFLGAISRHDYKLFEPHNEHFIPLYKLTYVTQFRLFGFDPLAFHWVVLILHVVTTALIALLVWMLTQRIAIAAFGAVFFAFHPVHWENVLWSFQGQIILHVAFAVGCLIMLLHYIRTERPKWFIGAMVLLFLQAYLFATGLIFPIIALAFFVLAGERRYAWRYYAAFLAIFAVNLAIYKLWGSANAQKHTGPVGLKDMVALLDVYTQSLFNNFGRAFIWGKQPGTFAAYPYFFTTFALGCAALVTGAVIWVRNRKAGNIILFSAIYYAIVFLPVSAGRFRFGAAQSFAGRYGYLYLVPLIIGTAMVLAYVVNRGNRTRWITYAATVCALTVFLYYGRDNVQESKTVRGGMYVKNEHEMRGWAKSTKFKADLSTVNGVLNAHELRDTLNDLEDGCETKFTCRMTRGY